MRSICPVTSQDFPAKGVDDNDLCIDHLQHTEAEVIVEQMGSFDEDGALLITVTMQMQSFRNYLLEHTA